MKVVAPEAGPEEEFLDNAATMVSYARREVQQFTDWTNRETTYARSAIAIMEKLAEVSNDLKLLRKEYDNR